MPGPAPTRRPQVVRLAESGLSNQQIAEQLGISINGVKAHLSKAGFRRNKHRHMTATEILKLLEERADGWARRGALGLGSSPDARARADELFTIARMVRFACHMPAREGVAKTCP